MRLLTGADRAKTPDTAIAGSQVIGRILGGDCAPTVVGVPWEQRLTALGRLARWAVTRTLRHHRGRLRSHPIAPR
jgi:hypothetical protein